MLTPIECSISLSFLSSSLSARQTGVDRLKALCYTRVDLGPDEQPKVKKEDTMAQEERKGKGGLLAILAAVGAIIAALTFWRRRRAS